MNRPKSVLRKWLLGVLVAIALLLVAAALIPALIDLDDYAQEVADGMSEALGVPVEIESGRLTVLPDLGFVASGISLPDGYGPLSEVNISRIRIDLNLLSLLSGEILVEEIHIKNPRIGMTLDEHARTPDKQYAGPKGARVFDFMQAPPMLPLALDVHVRGADLLIDDRITTPGRPIRTLFRDTRISVKGMNCSTPFQVRFASRVPHREGVGRIKATLRIDPTKSYVESGLFPLSLSGDVGIDGIGCSAFSGYLPEILRKAGLTANCSLNVNVSTQPQKEITLKGSLKADRLHLEHNLSGSDAAGYHDLDLSFTAGIADKGIRLQPVVIKIDENQIAGKLFFLQPPTGGTLLVYEFGAYSLPISTILDLTPSELLPRDEANWIRRIKLSGEIRRFMSGFAGKASDLFYVDEGTFIPRELGIICSIDGLNVRDHLGKLGVRASSGHLSLHEGVLEFDTAKWLFLVDGKELPTTRPPFIDLSIGALDDLIAREGSYSWGELLKGCDGARGSEPMVFVKCHTLELPVEVVNGILDGVPLPPRGAEFIDDCDGLSGTIKGDFDAALFLSGAMEPCVKGKIHIFGSRINYVPLDLPVRLLSVEADISHASANLKTLSVLGGSWPVVSHLDIEIERPYSTSPTISAKGDFRLQQDIGGPFSGEAGPAVLSIDGSEAFANLNASGSLDELKVSLEGDFSEPEIIYGDWLRKAAGENGRMSASARLIEFKSLQIDTARAELGGLVLRGLGEIDFQDEPRWNLSIDLPATNVSELARLSPNVQSLGGEAEVNGWLRLASQPNELAKAPPRSLQAVGTGGLALELNASAIKGLLSSQLMPDAVNEIAEDLNLPSGQARIGVTTGFSTGRLLDAEFKASLELKDVDASHDSFALGLSGFSGNLELTDQILRIRQLSGRLGESEFELDGSIKQPLMFALPGDRWREIQGDIHLVTRPQLKDIRT
ncbi:MAG: AsmA family protein, partial [Candidatus Coatesbacteria bacterium]|nr:AsmA family protein [Candidatus Coatesbacteria bacterium]